MKTSKFFPQIELLLRVLPIVAREKVFTLKGGTAINLYYRDMPRLSVDIDLIYLPIEDRTSSLHGITSTLQKIGHEIERQIPDVAVTEHRIKEKNTVTKLNVKSQITEVKIEPNTILRGPFILQKHLLR